MSKRVPIQRWQPIDIKYSSDTPTDTLTAILFLRSQIPLDIVPLIPMVQIYGVLQNTNATDIDLDVHQLANPLNGPPIVRIKKLTHGTSTIMGDEALIFNQDYLELLNRMPINPDQQELLDRFKSIIETKHSLTMTRNAMESLLNTPEKLPTTDVDYITQLIRLGVLCVPRNSTGNQVALAIPKAGSYLTTLRLGRKELISLLKKRKDVPRDNIESKFNKIIFANKAPKPVISSTRPTPQMPDKAVVLTKPGLTLDTHLMELVGAGWVQVQKTPMGEIIRLTPKGSAHSKSLEK